MILDRQPHHHAKMVGATTTTRKEDKMLTRRPLQTNAQASSSKPQYDVAVVGAGIVGSALAYSLAKSGRRVALFERDFTEPDRIVGELLQPGGVKALKTMGLMDCLDDIDAVPVEGYHVFYADASVPIPYPDEEESKWGKGIESDSGRVEGRSFHHGRFVQKLRNAALAQANVTAYEATVRQLQEDANGRVTGILASGHIYNEKGGGEDEELQIGATVSIVADGCFSKFRRTHGSTIAPTVRSNFVALELENAPLPSPHHGHVVLGPSGPTLLYQISTKDTRILIDVAGEKLPSAAKGELQQHIRDRVIPYLPEQLQPCVRTELDKNKRLRSMPNSFLPPSMQGQNKHRQGVILVGDAMNMRHPLTGGGMSVGLWDAIFLTHELGGTQWQPQVEGLPAVELAKDLKDWDSLKPGLRDWHWRRKGRASVINILAQALYSLFGADDDNLEVLRAGCFKYFEMGGECVGGPVSLLSGLAPRPFLLFYHFFSVAIYSIYVMFAHPRKDPSTGQMRRPSVLQYPGLVMRSFAVFYTACVVLLPVVFTEMRSNVPAFKAAAQQATQQSQSAVQGAKKQLDKGAAAAAQSQWFAGVNTTYLAVALAAVAAFVYSGQAGRPGSGIREIVFPGRFT
jgi:squalene monooxygenase